ncbi:hypothetical protein HK098_001804 [Nowakowskiella sp. JEL0407]|nr:hypothetical protein HK098_001804 [Nowakowskiella sp. JEL0407]
MNERQLNDKLANLETQQLALFSSAQTLLTNANSILSLARNLSTSIAEIRSLLPTFISNSRISNNIPAPDPELVSNFTNLLLNTSLQSPLEVSRFLINPISNKIRQSSAYKHIVDSLILACEKLDTPIIIDDKTVDIVSEFPVWLPTNFQVSVPRKELDVVILVYTFIVSLGQTENLGDSGNESVNAILEGLYSEICKVWDEKSEELRKLCRATRMFTLLCRLTSKEETVRILMIDVLREFNSSIQILLMMHNFNQIWPDVCQPQNNNDFVGRSTRFVLKKLKDSTKDSELLCGFANDPRRLPVLFNEWSLVVKRNSSPDELFAARMSTEICARVLPCTELYNQIKSVWEFIGKEEKTMTDGLFKECLLLLEGLCRPGLNEQESSKTFAHTITNWIWDQLYQNFEKLLNKRRKEFVYGFLENIAPIAKREFDLSKFQSRIV